jgi:hypothetical protein
MSFPFSFLHKPFKNKPMAENKKSFVLYCDLIHTVDQLPDEVAGKLFKLILDYVNDKNPKVDDILLSVAFEPIKRQLKRDLKDWEQIKQKRAEAGRKGGKATQSKFKQNQAKLKQSKSNQAVTVTVTDTVTVNDTVNVTSSYAPTIEMVREFFDTRGYVEAFADKFFDYYNSLGWENTNGKPIHKIWRHTAEQWLSSTDAIQHQKEEVLDDYEKEQQRIKRLNEEAKRWE